MHRSRWLFVQALALLAASAWLSQAQAQRCPAMGFAMQMSFQNNFMQQQRMQQPMGFPGGGGGCQQAARPLGGGGGFPGGGQRGGFPPLSARMPMARPNLSVGLMQSSHRMSSVRSVTHSESFLYSSVRSVRPQFTGGFGRGPGRLTVARPSSVSHLMVGVRRTSSIHITSRTVRSSAVRLNFGLQRSSVALRLPGGSLSRQRSAMVPNRPQQIAQRPPERPQAAMRPVTPSFKEAQSSGGQMTVKITFQCGKCHLSGVPRANVSLPRLQLPMPAAPGQPQLPAVLQPPVRPPLVVLPNRPLPPAVVPTPTPTPADLARVLLVQQALRPTPLTPRLPASFLPDPKTPDSVRSRPDYPAPAAPVMPPAPDAVVSRPESPALVAVPPPPALPPVLAPLEDRPGVARPQEARDLAVLVESLPEAPRPKLPAAQRQVHRPLRPQDLLDPPALPSGVPVVQEEAAVAAEAGTPSLMDSLLLPPDTPPLPAPAFGAR
jgi:hypothetical protein